MLTEWDMKLLKQLIPSARVGGCFMVNRHVSGGYGAPVGPGISAIGACTSKYFKFIDSMVLSMALQLVVYLMEK